MLACNDLIPCVKDNLPELCCLKTFLRGEDYYKVEGLLRNDGFHCMLQENDYKYIDMVFQFVSGYAGRLAALENEPQLMEVNTLYLKLFDDFSSNKRLSGIYNESIAWMLP